MTQDPVSPSIQWSSHMEPTSAKHVFQTQANPKFKQLPVSSNSPEAQGSMSVQLVSTRCPPQPWLTPTFEQISVPPGSVPAAWAIPIYSPAPSMPSQPLIGSVVKQPAARGPMNTSVQQILTVEPKPSRYSLQSWQSTPLEQVSVPPDHAAASWSIPIDPPAPRIPSQPLMGSVFKQPTSTELVNVSVSQSSSRELLPSRFPVQPRADPEHYVPEEGVTTLRRPRRQHSQPSVISEIKEEVSSGSLRASREQSISMETIPSKYAPQPWLGPEFEQQASSLENVAKEENVLTEAWLSGHPSESIIKHKVEKTPSGFESTSVEGGMPWRPVPPTCPTPLSIRSKVQETSCRLDSATAQDSSKKSQNIRSSSQSFVKFMAQQVFSDSATSEMDTYAKPVTARGRSRPSRSLLKPKLDEHVFLYNWDDDEPKKDTKSKNLPTKPPFQSSRRPEEPQEVLALSEGVPGKWNTSVRDVSQSPGKPEYKQNVSVSASFPDEWKRSEGQLPSTQPSQAFDVAELQPPILSADSANVPVEWRIPEGHQPPGQPPQSYLITDYQQQGYGSSPNAAAEGAIPEKNIACWAMLKGPASTKNVNYGQGYRDLTKSTSTSGTKPAKLASAPAQKAFVSMGAYFKEELPQYCDVSGNPSLIPTTKGDVENVFGVRLRKISQKIGMENPDPCESFAPVSPVVSKEQADKGALQDSERGPEKSSTTFNLEEKQGNRPKYESIWKKPAVYRPPDKTSSWKADISMEPTWIAMVKQRQRGFGSHFPKKSRARSEIRAETKEPRYETKYDPEMELLSKESESVTDVTAKMTFLSTISRHEMPQSRQFIKS
ncbi:similar to novel protein (predicted), partial [Rattus norvegicus]